MRRVTLYIETSSAALGKKKRICGYILEYITASGKPVIGKAYREGEGTYNQEYLITATQAMWHMKEPCELCICGKNSFVLNMIQNNLKNWAAHEYISNGKEILNRKEWENLWNLMKGHNISVRIGEHKYTKEMIEEMKVKGNVFEDKHI